MRKQALRIATLTLLSALILAASAGVLADMGTRWFAHGIAEAMRPAIEMATPVSVAESVNR